jgi:hypothetical protein
MLQMKRLSLPLSVLLLASIACGQTALRFPTPTLPASIPQVMAQDEQFTIGVEYGILGLAPAYTATGVTYAKLQDAFAVWGNIEPKPGQYDWGPLDALVREYQQAGFTGLQIDLSALSPWASTRQPTLGDPGDAFPKPENLGAYTAFVSAVVERYDGDGFDDMPGLLYPVHDYGIEREFSGFWPGTADEYVRLLKIAYPAIRSADPQANVLLVALLMTDVFDGNPSTADIIHRSGQTPGYMRKSVPDIQTILAACAYYNTVDFHSLGNYTEITLTAAWIRDLLKTDGCGGKPIWIGDAFPMSDLVGYGGFTPPIPFAPVTPQTRDAVVKLLQAVADPSQPEHAADQAWLYAEAAIGLTRKIIVSAGAGLRGINLGNLEDWKTGIAAADKVSVPLLGGSLFMGLTDTSLTSRKPGGDLPWNGQAWSIARRAGDLRPAWYALKLASAKIANFTSVTKLELGSGVWSYRFETRSAPVWVLWYDDLQLHLPGDPPPSVTVSLPFDTASARLTLTPTVRGTAEVETQTLQASGGTLTFDLGATPVFIEPLP